MKRPVIASIVGIATLASCANAQTLVDLDDVDDEGFLVKREVANPNRAAATDPLRNCKDFLPSLSCRCRCADTPAR